MCLSDTVLYSSFEETLQWIRTSGFPPSNWHREVVPIIPINMAQLYQQHPVLYDYPDNFRLPWRISRQFPLFHHQSISWILIYSKDLRKRFLWKYDANLCLPINTLRWKQDGCHFPDDIFKCIFLNENLSISIEILIKFVPMGPINNIPALIQIMAWHQPGDKTLSETMMVSLMKHICVTRPPWVLCWS